MTRSDLIGVLVFLAGLLAMGGWLMLRSLHHRTPRYRVRERLRLCVSPFQDRGEGADAGTGDRRTRRKDGQGRLSELTAQARQHVLMIAGPRGGLILVTVALLVFVVVALSQFLFLTIRPELTLLISLACSVGSMALAYRMMLSRYRVRFLGVFPDALDLIIRAVRAGVPVAHAIRTAGDELEEPVASQFRIMGDALRVGIDMQDVMDEAVTRIDIPDFTFFTVCLSLQRETGGHLSETLENLAGIIRARRELRLKTRALTAEGRLASKVIAAVPFAILGTLSLASPGYMDVMLQSETGRMMLWVSAGLLVSGLLIIRKISTLEV